MPRRPRMKLKFDEASVNLLLQEIYDDNHNLRAKLTALINKWEVKIKDEGHIAALGDQIVKLFNTQVKNQDQKIILLRYLKEVVYRDKNDGDESSIKPNQITSDGREELIRQVQESILKEKGGK